MDGGLLNYPALILAEYLKLRPAGFLTPGPINLGPFYGSVTVVFDTSFIGLLFLEVLT